ncbi:L-histidine N(alpha)-methyltransferase [Streptomyces sp. BE147]|uniref:L-histidine N(alpha)-methyltransferase n=1 Tax=Streptomyces sp. BE147 TaxID=3002524 RepID=UPI002E796D63|nr:L-histidine N(alpha)-methyltransferase [Streptomyces sp. BE147]MEE1737864.1 L-histidine N(alpha)-methyltransferase [Streptomyces sp. BE147]
MSSARFRQDQPGPPSRPLSRGLSLPPRWLPYHLLWDDQNSVLFDKIRQQPEYYLSRAEMEIIENHGRDLIDFSAAVSLLDLGTGTGDKALALLRFMRAPAWFAPMEINEYALSSLASRVAAQSPHTALYPVQADFTKRWPPVATHAPHPLLAILLGSTLGNFTTAERHDLFRTFALNLREGDMVALGVPLLREPAEMLSAYQDRAGLMAEFGRHCLQIMNTTQGADFHLEAFAHHVAWSEPFQRITVGLRARSVQQVTVPGMKKPVVFQQNEILRVFLAARFTTRALDAELATHGFESKRWVTDACGRYAVVLASRTNDPMA